MLDELVVYLQLARACKERMETPNAVRFLTIAGCCAWMLELHGISRLCGQQIAGFNPGHQAARFDHFGAALNDHDFQTLLSQLTKKYPPEVAADLARKYRLPVLPERSGFDSDLAYAAAAFGVDPEWVEEYFGDE